MSLTVSDPGSVRPTLLSSTGHNQGEGYLYFMHRMYNKDIQVVSLRDNLLIWRLLTKRGAPGRHCLGLVGVWLRHCSPDCDGGQPWEGGAGRGGGGAGTRLTRYNDTVRPILCGASMINL